MFVKRPFVSPLIFETPSKIIHSFPFPFECTDVMKGIVSMNNIASVAVVVTEEKLYATGEMIL